MSPPRACMLMLLSVLGCGGTTTAGSGSPSDAGADAQTDAHPDTAIEAGPDGAPDGGYCCPPDPSPGCCMHYGGWSGRGGCLAVCDGMPEPSDPAWHLTTDSYGCSVWSSAGSTGPFCGATCAPLGASCVSLPCCGTYVCVDLGMGKTCNESLTPADSGSD